MDSSNPFEQAENCFSKKQPVTTDSDCNANYMLLRALSMTEEGFYAATTCNNYANGCPKWAIRKLAHDLCPKLRKSRWEYCSKPATKKQTDKVIATIKLLGQYLHVSPKDAEDTYALMKDSGFNFADVFGSKI